MPGGGWKSVVINTQERAVSTDINRLQAFAGNDQAELLRYMLDVQANDDLDAGAVVTEFSGLGNPLRAEIINGLLVRPQLASFSLLVDPGVLLAIAPDLAADASNYKYVRDAGITALGTLLETTNPGPGDRIDVVECQVVEEIAETDNRDVFNPTTGLFSATPLTKALRARVANAVPGTLRMRAGAPGGGFPGTAAGWLPLAVVRNPVASASCDDMMFWDVRPLLSDRVRAPFDLTQNRTLQRKQVVQAITALGATPVLGLVEAESIDGRRLGGRVRSGTRQAVPDGDFMTATDVLNQESGFAPVVGRPWYWYLLTPFGLPRWARYTTAAAGVRKPRSPRGIPVVSSVGPKEDGQPTAAIALPTSTGLAGTTANGVCVGAGWVDIGPLLVGYFSDETGAILVNIATTVQPIEAAATSNVVAAGSVTWIFDLTANVHYPANARAVYLEMRNSITVAAGGGNYLHEIRLFGNGGVGTQIAALLESEGQANEPVGAGSHRLLRWVPINTLYPSTSPGNIRVTILSSNAGFVTAAASAFVRVLGWRM